MVFPRLAYALLLSVGLAACAGAVEDVRPMTPVSPAVARATTELGGLDARRLIAMFGEPRLDVRERTARKLQFANRRCVLDAYLYSKNGHEPVVAHVDARSPAGSDADPVACAELLRRQ